MSKQEFQEGDLVEVISLGETSKFYNLGDKGIIVSYDGEHYVVNFNDQGNVSVEGDGEWFVCDFKLKLISRGEV